MHDFGLRCHRYCSYKYEFNLSALEVYLNKVYDLLQAPVQNRKVEVKLSTETEVRLETEQEAITVINQAIDQREAAATNKNKTSSRSHFIITIKIGRRSLLNANEPPTTGFLTFCDLAGSEKVGENMLAGSSSLIVEQGQDINKGLLDLGQGIRNLAKSGKFLPGHNLTRALRQSLVPGSRLVLIATVSPRVSNQNTTLATLRWSADVTGARGSSGRVPLAPAKRPGPPPRQPSLLENGGRRGPTTSTLAKSTLPAGRKTRSNSPTGRGNSPTGRGRSPTRRGNSPASRGNIKR
ncbi:kinesin motor domain-containing protein [Nemania sp. FL0916]|nr:kinesin motor domain-containing protein [Nemania sp. FL0916]